MPSLSPQDFQHALAMFEALLSSQVSVGRNPVEATPEAIAVIDMAMGGFAVAYDDYVKVQRESVQNLQVGHMLHSHGGSHTWYDGPKTRSGVWPAYKHKLAEVDDKGRQRLSDDAIKVLDASTTRILSRCANPHEQGERRKGLVIGFVQSGKTANYAGLIAKAVDAGYRLIVVLAGMHSNLRAQTQKRLVKDLAIDAISDTPGGIAWHLMTGAHSDIGSEQPIGGLNGSSGVALMVVKKNATRLANVAQFLKSIPESQRRSRGILIIDDESDQATPNTLGEKRLVSSINQHVRDIWKLTLTGTYVAYTATPFANIFIDPSDPEDLYPEDFVMTLPRPDGYMGVDTIFDIDPSADGETDRAEIFTRTIPSHESDLLAPKGRKVDNFNPRITETLDDAIRWFVIGTAIRRIRVGESQHSSMLIHTSHLVAAHDRLKDEVRDFISALAVDRDTEEDAFRTVFDLEIEKSRAAGLEEEHYPRWADVWAATKEALGRVKVVVDNGQSLDRLEYPDNEPQTVIAIGGGTLSRGLTLEGLIVSYFLRTSSTYDTLLQMGRWFGFRSRYADLARVWVSPGLLDDYRHLARVEADLRADVAEMDAQGELPRHYALRVRAHPGRLSIVAPSKMWTTEAVHVGLGGTRHQGTLLDRSVHSIDRTKSAVDRLVHTLQDAGEPALRAAASGSVLVGSVGTDLLTNFLDEFVGPEHGSWLQGEAVRSWATAHRPDAQWNIVLVSGRSTAPLVSFGEISVHVVKRTPVRDWGIPDSLADSIDPLSDIVNVRALMSGADWILDQEIKTKLRLDSSHGSDELSRLQDVKSNANEMKRLRKEHAPNEGQLLIYVVDKDSRPSTGESGRLSMDAADHLIGLGIVYPSSSMAEKDHDYVAVTLDSLLEPDSDDEAPKIVDNEEDFCEGN